MNKEITAQKVLDNLETLIKNGDARAITSVYEQLSIFDWWKNNLSITEMKQMKSFLKTAINMGFTGYVCFKVGVSGCANGMWAHKEMSVNGYSPNGDFLYRSFTPDYTCWEVQVGGKWFPRDTGADWNSCRTARQLQAVMTKGF